jgi:molybdenum cofactor cytidylyltransferase
MTGPAHAVILLAAGESRRLGQPKQLVVVEGEPLVCRAARAALATGPAQALIVVGARAEAVWGAVADLTFTRVQCLDWASGLSASIRAGVRAVDCDVDAALFVLCDQPALGASHLRALVDCWRREPQRACASAYAGTVGVPAILPRSWFPHLLAAAGDRGARDLLRARADDVLTVDAPWLAADVDRPADLPYLQAIADGDDDPGSRRG